MNISNDLPRLEGYMILVFPPDAEISQITQYLSKNVEVDKYTDCINITYAQVDDINSFELDDLLTELFALCDLDVIQTVCKLFNGKPLIDIAFYHNDIYPALVFEGKNMEIIHLLGADISIDPY